MDKFLKRHKLPKLTQEIENLNRPISTAEIEFIILKLPEKTTLGLDGFTSEFYQIFREEIVSILYKLFKKIEKITFPHPFYEASN